MNHRRALSGWLSDERGSALVVAGIMAVAMFLIGAVIVEVGQWFEHRRDIQVRADAAALATGPVFNECFDTAGTFPDPNADIEAMAENYGGFTSSASSGPGGGPYNLQFGKSSSDLMSFQSKSYPSASTPQPNDYIWDPAGECDQLKVDVKMTQAGIPPIFSISPLATVHGWARLELKQELASKPTLPMAIGNYDLTQVGVTFVDESNGGTELTGCTGSVNNACTFTLSQLIQPDPSTGTPGQYGGTVDVNLPPVTASAGHLIGMRISTGSQIGDCALTDGTVDYACIKRGGSPYDGTVAIRDYPSATTDMPALYRVLPYVPQPAGGTANCSYTDPYFSDYAGATSCPVAIDAEVDFGTTSNPSSAVGATLTATMPNASDITLTPDHEIGTSTVWLWRGTGTLPVDHNGVPVGNNGNVQSEYPIQLNWTSTTSVGGKKKGSFGCGNGCALQRFVSANNSDDGPVQWVNLGMADTTATSPYAMTPGQHSINVSITVTAAGVTNKLTLLRTGHSGSGTSLIQCTGTPTAIVKGNTGIQNGIENGCDFYYEIQQSPYDCSAYPQNPTTPYPDCALNKASSDTNVPIAGYFNTRFGCSAAPDVAAGWYPNRWTTSGGSYPGDKRAVTLVLTSPNAYGNGTDFYPVTGFGDFYITGYYGSTCPQSGFGADSPAPAGVAAGDVWGYFINYSNQQGIPSTKDCVRGVLHECVAVLTR